MLRLGILVNPVSGIGGPAGLKGSDGVQIQAQARAEGYVSAASQRMQRALQPLRGTSLYLVTWGGAMGADAVAAAGLQAQVLGTSGAITSAADTQRALKAMCRAGIDLLLFAGGDGTARDILDVLPAGVPVLGVPAGVKMHSGVFARTPEDAAALLLQLLQGELVAAQLAEVRDIDEAALREGRIASRFYGEMLVPRPGDFLQHLKTGGRETEALVVNEIADHVSEKLRALGGTWLLGPGSTLQAIKAKLGIAGTLLGVDIVHDGVLLVADADAHAIEAHAPGSVLVVSFSRGQGFLFGRGNQQISARALRSLGRQQVWVVGSRSKLLSLAGRPLALDTGDAALDQEWAGLIEIITGYEDALLYRLGWWSETA